MDKNVQEVNLNCRICNKIDSELNWLSSNLILKTGELVIAIKENGDKIIKIGDGTNTYKNLNSIFIDENSVNTLIKNAIPELTGDITSELIYDEETKTVKLKSSVVDNSHNHTISNISSLQEILDTKAPINNPAFTGTPTVPTAVQNTNTDQIASTKYVDTAIVNKTEITGNAGSATKLLNSRKISLIGDVTGSANFDGTSDININATVNLDSGVSESQVISLILALS